MGWVVITHRNDNEIMSRWSSVVVSESIEAVNVTLGSESECPNG